MTEELNNNNQEEQSKETETQKTYSEEEVQKLLQAEGDRRISQYQKTLEKKQREADKLKNMSETDRKEYELAQREEALIQKERALAMAENKAEGISILAQNGLSAELIDFVISEEAETMYANIKKLDKSFKACVKAEVEKRLGGKDTKASFTTDGSITKEIFAKMSLSEKQRLYNEDKETYMSLITK